MIYLRCVFIIAYLTILCLYFFSETSGNFKRRAVNKIALAVLFEAYAVSAYLLHSPLFSMRMILPIGLFFAFLGDIFLLWNFVRGGICFSIGNFCLLFYEIMLMRYERLPLRILFPALRSFSCSGERRCSYIKRSSSISAACAFFRRIFSAFQCTALSARCSPPCVRVPA